MPIPSEAANRSTTVDPKKWLGLLQRWHPRMPREELVDFINEFIEAAIEIKNTAANPPYAPASRCLPPQLSWYTKEELSGYARYRL
jgi:hypothetical protein